MQIAKEPTQAVHPNKDTKQPPARRRYGMAVAIAFVLAAALLRLVFLPSLGMRVAFVTFYPALMLAALYGGLRAGLCATFLSAVIVDYFWVAPTGSLIMSNSGDVLALEIFVSSGCLVSVIAEAMHRANVRALKAEQIQRDELERRIDQRTVELTNEIAERIKAEEALRNSERLYRAIGETINYGVWVCAPDGRNIYASPSFLDLLGISQQECSDLGWANFLDPKDAEQTIETWTNCVRAEVNCEIEHRYRGVDGQWHPILARGVPVRNDAGDIICWAGINLDISRMKQTEESLRKSQVQLRTFIHSTPIAIAMFDRDMNYLAYSQRWHSQHAPSLSNLVGLNHYQVNPDLPAEWRQVHQQGLAGASLAKDEELWVRVDGSRMWLRWAVAPWIDEDGKVGGIIISTEDITERKLAEEDLKTAKAEAERSVLARSKFLAAASHDLRQPVQSLVLLLEAIKPQATTERTAKAVAMMESALGGLNGLLTSILDISRVDAGVVVPQMGSVDIGVMLHRFRDGYAPECGHKHLKLRCRCAPGMNARTDVVLLERILRNLIENAIRYTHHGGLLIGTRRRGDRIRIDIVDSGIGIPADKLTHIFEEFYQVANPARDDRQGLGLGLAIVSRLTRLIGADVQVQSRQGRGTCFTVTVPADDSVPLIPSSSGPAAVVTGQRILVIEDNSKVRAGLELLLESWSCEAFGAESGEDALEIGKREGWRFDAIIADHRLGAGLSGTETACEISKRAGRMIPTVIVTGDTAPERISEVHASGFEMMHKPITPDDLGRRLAWLLREA